MNLENKIDLIEIRITGEDATKFLQGQLTCDVETLSNNGSYTAHCNPKGRIISFYHITPMEMGYQLITPRSMQEIDLQALKKYAVFYKVNFAVHEINDTHQANLKLFDIHHKIPRLYPETSGLFLPHELGINKYAISFKKGCFTGQEIIARMEYRGKTKTQLYSASIAEGHQLKPGDEIYTNIDNQTKAVAQLVDIRKGDDNTYYTLIICNQEAAKPNTLFVLPGKQYLKL